MLTVLALVVYNANGRVIPAGDTFAARYLPFAVLHHGTVLLDPVVDLVRHGHPDPYWVRSAPGGRFASLYPVATPLLVTPLYVPAALWAASTPLDMKALGIVMEKLAASTVAALTAGLMFLLLRRRLPVTGAVFLAAAFAFATNTWTTSSQALWQHGVGQLGMVTALFCLTGAPSWARLAGAGLALGVVAVNRPPDVLLVVPLVGYVLVWARWRVPWIGVAAAAPVGLALLYNWTVFQTLGGGYEAGGVLTSSFFHQSGRLSGAAGLLFSPGKGLFVFSPFLLAGLLCLGRAWADARFRWLDLGIAAGFALQVALYAGIDWRAGVSFGPRFLVDAIPGLTWLAALALRGAGPGVRVLLLVAAVAGAVIQGVGAFRYTGLSDVRMRSMETGRGYEEAWRLVNTPYVAELQQPWPPRDVTDAIRALVRSR